MNDEIYLTTKQAAAMLRLKDASAIRHLIRRGKLRAEKRGRDLFIPLSEIERLAKKRAG